MRDDPAWLEAAQRYLAAKAEADSMAERADAAKEVPIRLADHPNVTGGGLKLTRFWKQGSIDYKKVPALARTLTRQSS